VTPRVLLVGAGAIGVVYGATLARAGAEVSYLVRAPRREETLRGTTLTRVGLLGRRRPERLVPHEVLTTWDEVRCRGFDQVWLAVPTDAIDEALVRELASALPRRASGEGALVVTLAPGGRFDALVGAHVPRADIVRGSIALMCWHAPMEGSVDPRERATAPGWACLVPPGRGAGFAGERAGEIVRLLRRGGMPAHASPHVDRMLALDTAALMPVVLALEAGGWSFREVARGELAELAVRAGREALAIEARRWGIAVPLPERLFLRPTLLRLLLRLAPRLAPVDLEGFFRAHFLKVRRQTRLLVDEIAEDGARAGVPSESLRALAARCPPPRGV
jgi:2-dehydropantoate 2-reductase